MLANASTSANFILGSIPVRQPGETRQWGSNSERLYVYWLTTARRLMARRDASLSVGSDNDHECAQ